MSSFVHLGGGADSLRCGSYSSKVEMNVSVFRDALLKMKEVYEQSPQMGDAESLEPRLVEVKQILQKLDEELKRNQVSTATAPYSRSTYSLP